LSELSKESCGGSSKGEDSEKRTEAAADEKKSETRRSRHRHGARTAIEE